jgi:NAD-dependent dihydropyrimidine dehydrogenase PreA subunit
MKLSHNVLTRNATQYICLDSHLCRACWKCIEACPNGVIGKIDIFFHRHSHIEHPEKCKGCGKCVRACPQNAILAFRTEV